MKRQRVIFLLLALTALIWSTRLPMTIPADASEPLEEETKFVALTFDDGPRSDTTPRLLDGLRERGASATFFLVGQQLAGNEALVQRMKDEGHQVGNHTWSHVELQGATEATVRTEVGKTDAALTAILGEGEYWVRPPYGLLDSEQQKLFSVPLVHWYVDPQDWKLRNTDADVKAVLSKVQPGDIILMHDTVPASVDAALRIVDALEAKGYQFVTVKELLALYGVTPKAGTMYRSAEVVAEY
ncbi:MAG: polysaccharide deacetylase family protein [Oscillibacter sp.]|jgi:peptidoglycan/xylan/chitin deacetylase (PgdA/CDA1 family)|nr:polysaccharide deacetylase family protein [Oscillibacter sp.]